MLTLTNTQKFIPLVICSRSMGIRSPFRSPRYYYPMEDPSTTFDPPAEDDIVSIFGEAF